MDARREKKISKFLSYHLRHAPQKLGLQLQPGGWVGVDLLLRQARWFTRAELEWVVAHNAKQRFALQEGRIRAQQGHSLPIDLELEPREPPPLLYHGTAQRYLASILAQGLVRGRRHHVHLSADLATASAVGRRHGRLVLLEVQAGAMAAQGFRFFLSGNGVWLVEHVPAAFLAERA